MTNKLQDAGAFQWRRMSTAPNESTVLVWDTEMTAYEFIYACTELTAGSPHFIGRLEVIADADWVTADRVEDLEGPLADRQIVRFNAGDWSVTWIQGHGAHKPHRLEAVVGDLPNAMATMISTSADIPEDSVENALHEVRSAA